MNAHPSDTNAQELRARWLVDPQLAEARVEIMRRFEGQSLRFSSINGTRRYELHSCSPDWTALYKPEGQFDGYLEAEELLEGLVPKTRVQGSNQVAMDLRGFNEGDSFGFCPSTHTAGVAFRNVDFSFFGPINQFGFEDCVFHDCVFDGCQIIHCMHLGHYYRRCRFVGSHLATARAYVCCFEDCMFEAADLSSSGLRAIFKGCELRGCDFRKASVGIQLVDTRFVECDFRKAKFWPGPHGFIRNTEFVDCNFRGLKLDAGGVVPPGVCL